MKPSRLEKRLVDLSVIVSTLVADIKVISAHVDAMSWGNSDVPSSGLLWANKRGQPQIDMSIIRMTMNMIDVEFEMVRLSHGEVRFYVPRHQWNRSTSELLKHMRSQLYDLAVEWRANQRWANNAITLANNALKEIGVNEV